MKTQKHRKKQPRAVEKSQNAQRISTLGATIAALMVTPLTALGQSQEEKDHLEQ